MNDFISRADAIDMAYGCEDEFGKDVVFRFADYIRQLPSAESEIIHCKDCRFLIDEGDGYMCGNPKGWVVGTDAEFGCVLAERRIDD